MKLPSITLSLKYSEEVRQSEMHKITSSLEASEILRKCYNQDTFFMQEQFIILMLNQSNKVIGFYPLSRGGLTSTVVDLRLIFSTAINSFATALIISHNHPSGNRQPSKSDEIITKKIKDAGELLDIKLFDHIILTDESYFSFADEGIL